MLPMMHLNHDTGQQPKVVLRGLAHLRCPGNDLIGAAGRCRESEDVPQSSLLLSPKSGGEGVERKHEGDSGGFRFALPTLPAGLPREAYMGTAIRWTRSRLRKRSHFESLPFETIVQQLY